MTDTVRTIPDLQTLLRDGQTPKSITPQVIRDMLVTLALRSGAAINVKDAPYNAKGDGVVDDTAAIQAALVAGSLTKTRVVVPPGTYNVGSAITLDNDTYLEIEHGAVIQMTTRIDNLFTAVGKSNIHVSGKGSIRGTNTSYANPLADRIFKFDTCTNLSLIEVELAETGLGAWFTNCSGFDFNCRVRRILADLTTAGGYGILVTLNSTDFRIGGRFTDIGRHAIYISAGPQYGLVDDVIIDGCDGAALIFASFVGEQHVKGIAVGTITIHNVGRGSASTSEKNAIHIAQGVEDISLEGSINIDTCDGYGIAVEGSAFNNPTDNPQGVMIGSPFIANCTLGSILVTNAAQVSMVKPRIRAGGTNAIFVTVTGVDIGSYTDDIDIASYDINGAQNAFTMAGDSRLTDIKVGRGTLRNVTGIKFNIAATNTGVSYIGQTTTFIFTELALAAGSSNNPFAGNAAAAFFIAPENGFLVELSGEIIGGVSAGTIQIFVTKNGVSAAVLRPVIAAGSNFLVKDLGNFPVVQGDHIGVMYTTNAGFLPVGNNAIAQVKFAPFP